jgi:hypothetical protein
LLDNCNWVWKDRNGSEFKTQEDAVSFAIEPIKERLWSSDKLKQIFLAAKSTDSSLFLDTIMREAALAGEFREKTA